MNARKIYAKTMKFVWLKLGVGAVVTAISLALLALVMWIASLFGGGAVVFWMGLMWIGLTYGVYSFAMHYAGYMIKAAHIAVVTEAVTTGEVPENMVETGKDMVTSRFAATNVYVVLDRLIGGAVKQLQNTVGKIDNIFGEIPGVSTLVSFVQLFIGIALGYVDECCLGYTFIKKEDNAFKAGCDGVVVYFQNAKHLLKSALGTTVIVMALTFVAWLVPFIIMGTICKAMSIPGGFAALLAMVIALAIKAAFIDSYMMVRTMVAYMQVAPSTEVGFDIYDKLCKLSGKFKELFKKAQEPTTNHAAA